MSEVAKNGDFPVIRWILFDLGGVLVDIHMQKALHHWESSTGIPGETWENLLFSSGLKESMDKGLCSVSEVIASIQEEAPLSEELFCAGWEQVLTPRWPMIELATKVSGVVETGLLSNTDPVHHRWAKRTFLGQMGMSAQFVSYEWGCWKPELRFYRSILDRVPFSPNEILFIDDLQENVLGARKAGMRALRFESQELLETELAELGIEVKN